MANSYPRVLIINGDPFNRKTATGITLCNLFNGWEKDKIAMIYNCPIEPETDICNRYWYLTKSNFPVVAMARRLKGFVLKFNYHNTVELTGKIARSGDKPGPVYSPNEVLGAWADMATLRIPKQLWEWIEEFKPDLIYSHLVNIRIMNLVLKVAKRFSLPIVPHFMDDWPTTLYAGTRWIEVPRWYLLSRFRKVLLRSPIRLAISEAMALEFKARYGLHFEAFMNCVETLFVSVQPHRRDDTCIRFGYIGGLHLNRWHSLKDIAVSLQKIHNEGINVELVVYAPSYDIERYGHILSTIAVVKIGGTLTSEKVINYLQQFDVLIHIESFDECDRLYTRFSISTKIPQYMASGKPILAYGPDEVASCKYIKENNCGVIVGDQKLDLLSEALKTLAMDQRLRDRLGSKGRIVALTKHNAGIEHEKLRTLLGKLIGYGSKI